MRSEFTGESGVIYVNEIVNKGEDVWIPFPSAHDKGIDGIIQYNRTVKSKNKKGSGSRTATGNLVLVQIKAGLSWMCEAQNEQGYIRIKLGDEHIASHRPLWQAFPEPVILIYLRHTATKKHAAEAWWTDLRDASSYSTINKDVVLLPNNQTFGVHSKGHIKRLLGTIVEDHNLPEVVCTRRDARIIGMIETPKKSARAYYLEWARSAPLERTNPNFGEVTVSRSGWRHITRIKRSPDRIFQSFPLLSAARKMIREVGANGSGYLGHAKEKPLSADVTVIKDYVGLRAIVVFPHRGPAVIQVVLRRKRIVNRAKGSCDCKVWFHSVYELRRGPIK